MPMNELKNNGYLILRTNPLGRETWWFKKGRKLNYETRCCYDRDGFDRWGGQIIRGLSMRGAGGWKGQRFRKMIKRVK